MLFHSTRGKDSNKSFEEVLMQGLASDGGLFMPNEWPQVDISKLKEMNSFIEIAKYIVPLYTKSSFTDEQVQKILDNTWHSFSDSNLAKIKELDDSKIILELFHGPTAAFKDFGLQLAASFFNESLIRSNKTAIVLGATSGDTGSAAIDSCKRFDSIKSFILLPEGNMSEVQRRQMTTVNSDNVFVLKVNGTFDDCQNIVKEGFKVRSFLKNDQYLLAVNSINWVRIIGQICYYFYASLKISKFKEKLSFSVPTGNFGNVFACYSAFKMGMPLNKIIVAVNNNNILHRFFENNDYSKNVVKETISPSMDISIASNFERLIYDFYANRDSNLCSELYSNFPEYPISVEKELWKKSKELFASYTVDDTSTVTAMRDVYKSYDYLMDPHTAVALESSEKLKGLYTGKNIILATAHPAKFPKILEEASLKISSVPERLSLIFNKEERFFDLPASKEKIFNFISDHNK
ncbi:threonine synthase [SAR86 cluster bacterium]|jgi:threonine synthase|nr:threonine synthase [SAR86 cluster bacterium]|tara:strand:- start:375 stop:1763 length:1389 start_codon:yes stop_codon:yes gene_type:complete